MTSANRPENVTDDGNQESVPAHTERSLLPATVGFTQTPEPSVAPNVRRSSDTPQATQPAAIRPPWLRRIVTIGATIGGLALLCATIVLTISDEKDAVTIDAPKDLVRPKDRIQNEDLTKKEDLPVAESSPQKIDAVPVVIVEPPTLEDWLKDRTILTVAQDDTAQFTSIQAALNALQPGQVVEVLDAGPYRERLTLGPAPPDVGLISRVQTRVEFASSELASVGDLLYGHDLHGLNQFRIHGFEFAIPDNPEARKRDVVCFNIWESKGVVFENCAVRQAGAGFYLVFGNNEKAAVPPHVIRECALQVNLQGYSHQSESEIMVLRNHLSAGLALICQYRLCVVRNNIFLDAHFNSPVIYSDAYECSNNTFLGRRPSIHVDTRGMVFDYEKGQRGLRGEQGLPPTVERGRAPTGHGVIFNNLHPQEGFLNVSGGGEQDPWPWEIAYNCYPGDGYIPAANALPRPANTLATPTVYGIKPRNPNYARLRPDSPGAKSGKGGAWPSYAGALPPGPAPQEGDWFTRLQSRWINRQVPKSDGTTRPLAFQKPDFDAWMKEVAELSPQILADRVTRKLVELNPGFDGNVEMPVENGIVRHCKFHTDNVTDISPIRALRDLRALMATGSKRFGPWDHQTGTGKLSDLSPLQGMSLEYVELFDNPLLEDISPLAGIPLKAIHCEQTDVADLSPLKGMKLEGTSWSNTRIWDLSVFQGMPITYLTCEFTDVSDFSPLAGMPLTFLASGFTGINDLAPLQGLPLEFLNCNGTGVTDLSALSHSRLKRLFCSGTRVSDLSPLRGLPLKEIYIRETPVSDVTFLQMAELETILFDANKIVKGMNVLRRMKTLKTIKLDWDTNTLTPAEFWKRYDTGEFGKPEALDTTPEVVGIVEKAISPCVTIMSETVVQIPLCAGRRGK